MRDRYGFAYDLRRVRRDKLSVVVTRTNTVLEPDKPRVCAGSTEDVSLP